MKKKRIGFWIAFVPALLLMLAVLELSRNTLWGFVLTLLASAAFVWIHGKTEGRGKRALCSLGFLALFAGILFLTRPPVRAVPATQEKSPASSRRRSSPASPTPSRPWENCAGASRRIPIPGRGSWSAIISRP